MKLSELTAGTKVLSVSGNLDMDIEGLSEDSRKVQKGFLFFARKGAKVSGLDYIREAVVKGARAVASEERIDGLSVPSIQVSSFTQAQIEMSEIFYQNPSKNLTVVGVTGTNGKTTFTYLLESIAKKMGWKTGVMGTINYRIPESNSGATEILPAPNTTPNVLEIQSLLHRLLERKADLVIMEVSSHALAQGRVDPIEFDGVVFTNLTQDHLDFHKTIPEYFQAKAKLFQKMNPFKKEKMGSPFSSLRPEKFAAVNRDDPYGQKIASLCPVPVTTYGIKEASDLRAGHITLNAAGSQFTLRGLGNDATVRLSLPGLHNIYNALAAAASACKLGVPPETILSGLESLTAVPGRLEPVQCGQNFAVFVDYAHTEDAMKNVLESLRAMAKGRILTLFGCGGDRDRSKRPLMGALAAGMSDAVIVTSDNPRSEDPQKITLDIEAGIRRAGFKNYEVILDREKAIERILQMAQKDDIVLLAGKGHENVQIFADRTVHFDDREIARKILSQNH